MNQLPDLHARTVLVPGGTGNVGEGIVRTLLTAGARVVVPSRSADRLDSLRELIGTPLADRLEGVVATYETFADADELGASLSAKGIRVTDVVALVGGWWSGKALWEISESDWARVFVSPATTHIALVRAFLPHLDPAGSYTLVAGFSSYSAEARSGPVSMQGAAQLMMRRVLSKEITDGPRVNDLMLGPIINRSRPQGRKQWLTADEVGMVAARVISDPTITDTTVDIQTRASFEELVGTSA